MRKWIAFVPAIAVVFVFSGAGQAQECEWYSDLLQKAEQWCASQSKGCNELPDYRQAALRACGGKLPNAMPETPPSRPPAPVVTQTPRSGAPRCEDMKLSQSQIGGIWNDTITKKREVLTAGLQDLRAQRAKLRDDRAWQASQWRELVAVIASTTKTTTDLIEGLARLSPTGAAIGARLDVWRTAYDAISRGRKISDIVEGDAKKVINDEGISALAKQYIAGHAFLAAKELTENVNKTVSFGPQFKELRSEMERQIAIIDAAIARIEQGLRALEGPPRANFVNDILARSQGLENQCRASQQRKP